MNANPIARCLIVCGLLGTCGARDHTPSVRLAVMPGGGSLSAEDNQALSRAFVDELRQITPAEWDIRYCTFESDEAGAHPYGLGRSYLEWGYLECFEPDGRTKHWWCEGMRLCDWAATHELEVDVRMTFQAKRPHWTLTAHVDDRSVDPFSPGNPVSMDWVNRNDAALQRAMARTAGTLSSQLRRQCTPADDWEMFPEPRQWVADEPASP